MKVLLTGASSYLGARLFVDLSHIFDVVGTYSSHPLSSKFIHLDITDTSEIKRVIGENRPDIIVHSANNASAKWCDAHPEEATRLNQTSMSYIVDAAHSVHAKVIYISSFSANDSSTMYGKTKHEAEQIIKTSTVEYLIIRPSLILGYSPNTTNDRPFNRILKNLDEHTPAVYDTSWKFQPTYIRHISEVIQMLIDKNIWNKTISVASPKIVSRFDVACDILNPFGVNVTPIDNHDHGVLLTDDFHALKDLGLPEYTYEAMIQKIVEEIKNRKPYTI